MVCSSHGRVRKTPANVEALHKMQTSSQKNGSLRCEFVFLRCVISRAAIVAASSLQLFVCKYRNCARYVCAARDSHKNELSKRRGTSLLILGNIRIAAEKSTWDLLIEKQTKMIRKQAAINWPYSGKHRRCVRTFAFSVVC